MTRLGFAVSAAMVLGAPLLGANVASAVDVQVAVENVGSTAGVVRAEVCTSDEWLKDGCALTGVAPARAGRTVVTVHNVPPGTWAIVAYHDKKDDGRVDRSWLGVPEDGIGFSRNPSLGLTGPQFTSSALPVDLRGTLVDVHLHFE